MNNRDEQPGSRSQARAFDQGRIYQATGDQHITEHHHHHYGGSAGALAPEPLFQGADWRPDGNGQPSAPGVQWLGPSTVRMPLVGTTPPVLRDRSELMAELRAAVAAPGGGGIHVLHGMGGMGKTAVAHALFQEVARSGERIGFWVNAADHLMLRTGMLAVAADRGADSAELVAAHSGQRAAADLVWHYLDRSPEPWLLVLDNLDEPEVLAESAWLRSSPRGAVLVTSRLAGAQVWRGATRHLVDALPLPDAAQALHDLAPEAGTLEEAELVAERLGRLPLALNLAGSYLAHQLLESWTLREYRSRLQDSGTALVDLGAASLPSAGETDARRYALGSTWQLSLEGLDRRGLPEATTLLRLLSCLAAEPLPLAVLAPAAAGGSAALPFPGDRLEPALRGLLDHSLVGLAPVPGNARGTTVRCIKAHLVLLDTVAEGVPEDERPGLLESAAHLLDAAFPADESPAAQGERLRLLVPHAVALLRRASAAGSAGSAVRLALRMTGGVHEAGDFRTSLSLANEIARAAAQVTSPEHPDTLTALYWVARSLFRLGRFSESEELHRSVLADRERLLGPRHADTLASLAALNQPLIAQGQAEEAAEVLRRAADGQAEVLGPSHPATLESLARLPEMLAEAGDFPALESLGPAVVADCERQLGSEHPTTVMARHNWAFGLAELGRWDEADAAATRVLEERLRVFGPDHTTTLSARVLLSRIRHGQQRYDEAVELATEVVEESIRVLGADHPYTAGHRQRLAHFLADAGRADETE